MKRLVTSMLNRLDESNHEELISWAAPVPCFGNLRKSPIATLGINPSNREFVDEEGNELTHAQRRFHTLKSLSLKKWTQAGTGEIDQIIESCDDYFFRNPYGNWFNRLNPIVGATGYSYYDRIYPACHIDLLPFATDAKWGTLASGRRQRILRDNSDLLLQLIQSSNLKMIILNGQSVVNEFISATGAELEIEDMPSWALPRTNGGKVSGTAYYGICEELNGIELKAPLKVLGFNHNIQSSFGVTTMVIRNIADWVKTQGRSLEFA